MKILFSSKALELHPQHSIIIVLFICIVRIDNYCHFCIHCVLSGHNVLCTSSLSPEFILLHWSTYSLLWFLPRFLSAWKTLYIWKQYVKNVKITSFVLAGWSGKIGGPRELVAHWYYDRERWAARGGGLSGGEGGTHRGLQWHRNGLK